MINIDEITHNYIFIEILHYLENNKILDKLLYDWLDVDFILKDEKLNFFFVFLQYKDIVFIDNYKYNFKSDFKENFLKLWYSKFLIFDWYKDFFNLLNKNSNIKSNEKIAKWSYDLSSKLYKDFFSDFLLNNEINSLIDLWCWNWNFIIYLAQKFPNKFFYWIELDVLTYNSALTNISNLWIKNVKIYNENILNIDNIELKNVDLVISFFVLHEINNVPNLIKNIIYTLNPKYFIIREFTPPKNILDSNLEKKDQFFLTYIFIHFLTNQNTLLLKDWIEIFNSNLYKLTNIVHIEKYNDSESLYPLIEFKRQ